MRLIDVDALEESLENSCKDTYETKMFVDFMSYVDEAPTVEMAEDCVKRIDAINGIANTHFAISYENYKELINVISNLPPAVPQTKSGKWIEREDNTSFVHQIPRMWIECSCCGWSFDRGYKNRFLYCPKCGADMKG